MCGYFCSFTTCSHTVTMSSHNMLRAYTECSCASCTLLETHYMLVM
jgi:hypothetical protein